MVFSALERFKETILINLAVSVSATPQHVSIKLEAFTHPTVSTRQLRTSIDRFCFLNLTVVQNDDDKRIMRIKKAGPLY